MQLQNQSCASALPLALIATLQAPQPPREQRLNRASRGLNSQFIDGASRRLKSQRLAGTSRRLNSQSVAMATAPLQLSGWLPAESEEVVPAVTGRSKSWCFRVVSSGKVPPRLPPRAPPALPNHSLNRSANGRPPGPAGRYAVHFLPSGPGVLPSSPA